MLPTTAAIEGLRESPAGGCVISAPRKMTGSLKIRGRTAGKRMLNKINFRCDEYLQKPVYATKFDVHFEAKI